MRQRTRTSTDQLASNSGEVCAGIKPGSNPCSLSSQSNEWNTTAAADASLQDDCDLHVSVSKPLLVNSHPFKQLKILIDLVFGDHLLSPLWATSSLFSNVITTVYLPTFLQNFYQDQYLVLSYYCKCFSLGLQKNRAKY